jgi:hypothetical protein
LEDVLGVKGHSREPVECVRTLARDRKPALHGQEGGTWAALSRVGMHKVQQAERAQWGSCQHPQHDGIYCEEIGPQNSSEGLC